MQNKLIYNTIKLTVLLSFLLLNYNSVFSQCSYCTAYYGNTVDEHISRVTFGDIDKKTSASEHKTTTLDYTSLSTEIKAGQQYTIKVEVGPAAYGSSDYVRVFFDWNQDCDLTDTDEAYTVTFLQETSDINYYETKITVPTTAKAGNTRMRVSMYYNTVPQPCDNNQYAWGESEDYTVKVILPAPDAGIASIIPPTSPYNEGTYPVSMVLGSYGEDNLMSCTVNWSVNGVAKTPYYWSGDLAKNSTVQIPLGTHSFTYPAGGPYNPFTIRVWLTNIIGKSSTQPDADPGNNDKNINTSPSTEDAQPVAVTQPSGAFIPGSVPIWVQIKNNARKPLTVVDIDWYIDGVKQGTKKWFGTLGQNETAEVQVGSYNFYFKTPLSPFEIKAVTNLPNGVADPITTNDEVKRSVAPSLVAGTYYIGGTNAHFPTLADAVNYLNASGILGDGDVIMKINSGTYNEQVMLQSFPHGNNRFFFESASGNAADVKLTYSPNYMANYIFGVTGVNDITFRNLTFNVTDGGAGTAFYGNSFYGLTLQNVVFNGVQNGGYNDYSLIHLENVPSVSVRNVNTNYGYNGMDVYNYSGTQMFEVTGCKFQNYFNNAIFMDDYYYGGGGGLVKNKTGNSRIQSAYPIEIQNNEFTGMGMYPQGGIYLAEAALVKNNKFTNYSTTNSGNAAITIDAPYSYYSSLIESNTISNITGVSGIVLMTDNATVHKNTIATSGNNTATVYGLYLNGSNLNVNYNKFIANGTVSNPSTGIYSAYASGTLANNLVSVTNGRAFTAEYNSGLAAYYNTFATNSNSYPAAYFNFGQNAFMRNIVINNGTNRSVVNSNSFITSAENIFFTKGTTNQSDLTAWINTTYDQTSSNIALNLTDDGLFKFATFQKETLTYYPLGIGSVESYDYYNMERAGFFYAGYAGIMLDIEVIEQPASLLACNGETDKQLFVAAAISYGAQASYQWQKNGIDIPGATNPIYKIPFFNYETTGQYRCRIYGPANTAAGIYSDEVLVYTLRPTEITRQPADVGAITGGTAFFEVEVHIKGIIPPLFQHKYQWWRHYNGEEVQLMDNENYANTTSPIMTITNIQDKHFTTGEDDYYYCVIEGLCGMVTTRQVQLNMLVGEVVFDVQPYSQDICLTQSLELNVNAAISGGTEPLTYQWYFNGLPLTNSARVTGVTTNKLTISNVGPDDEGEYFCEAISEEFNRKGRSETAVVGVNYPPIIETQPADLSLKEGEDILLSVVASGVGPFSYQWFKDDVLIDGATLADYGVNGATLAHSGFYFCNVTNDCGTTKTSVAQVIVSKDGGVSGISEADAIGMSVTPNPAVSDINISYNLDQESQVEIALLDLTGKKVHSQLSSGITGTNTITMTLSNKLSSGTYFVQVSFNGKSFIRQIVVNK